MTASDQDRVAISLKTLVDLAQPAASLRLRASQIRASQNGHYVSRFKGRGMAFAETRLYQPGDDVRRMDWRVTARTDKPHSKIFHEERERPLFISVDYRPAMQFATRGVFKAVQAARLAGLLAWAGLQQGDRIGGQIFSDQGCLELKPRTGKAALLHFFKLLTTPHYHNPHASGLEQAWLRLQHHAHPGSRIFLISDFRDLTMTAEQHLAQLARHCEIVLIQVYDPLESQLPETGRYRFTDRLREVMFDSANKAQLYHYQRRFQQRQAHLQQLSHKLNLQWLSCSTQQSPLAVLASGRL